MRQVTSALPYLSGWFGELTKFCVALCWVSKLRLLLQAENQDLGSKLKSVNSVSTPNRKRPQQICLSVSRREQRKVIYLAFSVKIKSTLSLSLRCLSLEGDFFWMWIMWATSAEVDVTVWQADVSKNGSPRYKWPLVSHRAGGHTRTKHTLDPHAPSGC